MGYEAFRLLAGKPQKPDFLEHLPKPPKGQSWPPEVIDNLKPAQKEALSKWRQQTNQWKKIAPYLLDPGPDVVIADEGHKIKNKDTGLTKLVNKFQTLYRVALTGSPLQNNLEEYRVMINWVRTWAPFLSLLMTITMVMIVPTGPSLSAVLTTHSPPSLLLPP